jgi:transcription antitermination protein NusB
MTRVPKSGGAAHGGKSHGGKFPGAKRTETNRTETNRTRANSSGAKSSDDKSPEAESSPPMTRTSVAKGSKTPAADKTGGPRSGSHKDSSPRTNMRVKPQAGQPAASAPRKANRRGAARLAAVQALYQMDMTGAGLNEILAQFESHWLGREVEGEQYLPAEAAFFRDIVSGVVDGQRDLDPRIDAALEATWPLKRIEAILRSVLRAGAWELEKRADIPARVVVSEYVDVAHAFVDKTETGMVNAVLDRLARNVRAEEFG